MGRKKNVVIYICAHNFLFFFFDKCVHTNCAIQSNVLLQFYLLKQKMGGKYNYAVMHVIF